MDISGTAVCMPRDASRDDVLAHLNKLHAYVNFRFDFPHSSRTISHCTSPFNLRLQFFKRVECNGTDSNVVKDPVEPKDEIRFPAPDWLCCNGSRWALKVDEGGVRHQSDLRKNPS